MEQFRIRQYTPADFEGLLEIQRACFPPPFPECQLWSRDQIESHVKHFPQGALCIETETGELAASGTALIIQWNPGEAAHSWGEASADGFISNHNPRGNSLYGIDIAVHPFWRGRGLAKTLYEARKRLVVEMKLERFMAAGRMPGYFHHRSEMNPREYAVLVSSGKLTDPVLTPQIKSGLKPLSVVENYIEDEESYNCALLLEWENTNVVTRR